MVEAAQFFKMRELSVDEMADGETLNSETWIDCVDRLDGNASAMPTVTSSPPALARYVLKPITGQRHQLRVHMNALGLPIVGDQFYPQVLRGPHEEDDHSQALQLLAKGVSFIDPITGEPRSFVSQQTLSISAEC